MILVGRSSSHFTRLARLFAAELGIDLTLQVVPSLMSLDSADYGGNPALRMPTLRTPEGDWYGSSSICRELERRSTRGLRIVWPETAASPLLANAQELTTQAMSTEVSLVMSRAAGTDSSNPHQAKLEASLENLMAWLEANVDAAIEALPHERDLSYLEASLFCLLEHLEFRQVMSLAAFPRLWAFRDRFGARPSASLTAFRFD